MSNTTKILIGALIALLVIVLCAVIGFLAYRAFLQPEAAVTAYTG